MKRSDIPDHHVLYLAWRARHREGPHVVPALVAEGVPEKVAYAKVLHMVRRGLMDYGVSPYYAWSTGREDHTSCCEGEPA